MIHDRARLAALAARDELVGRVAERLAAAGAIRELAHLASMGPAELDILARREQQDPLT